MNFENLWQLSLLLESYSFLKNVTFAFLLRFHVHHLKQIKMLVFLLEAGHGEKMPYL